MLYEVITKTHNSDIMVFTKDVVWFKPFNIHYSIGVDGISVSLLLLTAIVVLAGVFISWKMFDLPKEFFISLIVLSLGVYGVFISIRITSYNVCYTKLLRFPLRKDYVDEINMITK